MLDSDVSSHACRKGRKTEENESSYIYVHRSRRRSDIESDYPDTADTVRVRGGSTAPNLLYPHGYRGNSLSTSLQGQQGMQGVVHLFGVVQAHRTSSNLLEPHHYKERKVCRVLSHEFWVVRLYRTFFISLLGKQGMKGAYALVRGGSSTSNLVEPSRTTSLQR